jgi:hypothetical protein
MIPKPYTADDGAGLEASVLRDGAFEKIVVSVIEEHRRACARPLPPAGEVFPVVLLFELAGPTPWSPPRTVKFYARAAVDTAAPRGFAVPDAGRQALRAAAHVRRVRRAVLN